MNKYMKKIIVALFLLVGVGIVQESFAYDSTTYRSTGTLIQISSSPVELLRVHLGTSPFGEDTQLVILSTRLANGTIGAILDQVITLRSSFTADNLIAPPMPFTIANGTVTFAGNNALNTQNFAIPAGYGGQVEGRYSETGTWAVVMGADKFKERYFTIDTKGRR